MTFKIFCTVAEYMTYFGAIIIMCFFVAQDAS